MIIKPFDLANVAWSADDLHTGSWSYIEEQCRDGSESLHVDHGQSVWQMALPRPHKEQPGQMSIKQQLEECIDRNLIKTNGNQNANTVP